MRQKRNERGTAVVEFAIVLPILVLILLSMIDFGRYFYTSISLSSASFEVADAVARGLFNSSDDLLAKQNKLIAVTNDISPGIASFAQLNQSASLVFDPIPETCPNPVTTTTAKITTTFNSISPFEIFADKVSSSTTMRCIR